MMNHKKIYLLLISFFIGLFAYAQKKSNDTVINKRQLFIGVDLLNPVVGLFSDKKYYNAYLSYKVKNRWFAVAELGYETNEYHKLDWDVDAKGIYGAIGFNYILTNYYEKTGEGFYAGARLGFSPYKQQINQYPIKAINVDGKNQTKDTGSLPEDQVSTGWFEAVLGAKLQIGESPFYIDFIVKPKFILFSQKQDGIDNLVIPGYGQDKGPANISVFWGVSYRLF